MIIKLKHKFGLFGNPPYYLIYNNEEYSLKASHTDEELSAISQKEVEEYIREGTWVVMKDAPEEPVKRNLSSPIIVCAAIRNKDGVIIPSPRHFDHTCRALLELTGLDGKNYNWEQGFIDQHGKFYNREDALKIAVSNDQIRRNSDYETDNLYSENLY